MTLELSRAERSRLHLAALRALGDDDGARAAYAEAVAWHGSGGIADLATLYDLSEAIDHFVYQAVYRSNCEHAQVNADELRAVLGVPTVNLAMKMAGIHPRERVTFAGDGQAGRKMIWTTASGAEPTIAVRLPGDLLDKWQAK